MKFRVLLTESVCTTLNIEAETPEEAEEIVKREYGAQAAMVGDKQAGPVEGFRTYSQHTRVQGHEKPAGPPRVQKPRDPTQT